MVLRNRQDGHHLRNLDRSHMALPREGHLTQLFHMFAYLKKKHNSRMVFDPSYPLVDEERFKSDED